MNTEGGRNMSTIAASKAEQAKGKTGFSLIDCDVHPYMRDGLFDLAPYMTTEWRHRLGLADVSGWAKHINGGTVGMPKNEFYRISSGALRSDTAPPNGGVPGSDPAFVAQQLLDEYEIDRAILIGGPNSGHGAFPHAPSLAAVCSAYNDWILDTWCSTDKRYLAAILVPPTDAELAVQEIERLADRPGVAAIHMPVSDIAPGEKHFYPVYEAAQHYGLPIMIHPGATESIYVKAPRLSFVPTFYLEFHTLLTQPAMSSVVSLICHGVFERFPRLKYVFAECGFAWAVDVMWRLERDWKAQRVEVPWVKKHPFEYLESNVRFTTQPFYEAEKREQIHAVLDVIRAEKTLLFSSDYPHWDFDDPRRALADLPKPMRERVFSQNAIETFGDRLS
ncbi:MAG: amidohydrolase [Thermoleophilia bacterium]|nr:amidohydrolase [Thermoleophilia bacterium]